MQVELNEWVKYKINYLNQMRSLFYGGLRNLHHAWEFGAQATQMLFLGFCDFRIWEMGFSFPKLTSKFNHILLSCCPRSFQQKKKNRKNFSDLEFFNEIFDRRKMTISRVSNIKALSPRHQVKVLLACRQIHGFAMLQYSCPH